MKQASRPACPFATAIVCAARGRAAGREILRRDSDEASEIRYLQELLRFHNIDAGKIDGDFGPITEGAVKTFQSSRGLKSEGVVGKDTWEALIPCRSAISRATTPPLVGRLAHNAAHRGRR